MSTDEVKTTTTKPKIITPFAPFGVRQRMKVVEAILPDDCGLEESFWSGTSASTNANIGTTASINASTDSVPVSVTLVPAPAPIMSVGGITYSQDEDGEIVYPSELDKAVESKVSEVKKEEVQQTEQTQQLERVEQVRKRPSFVIVFSDIAENHTKVIELARKVIGMEKMEEIKASGGTVTTSDVFSWSNSSRSAATKLAMRSTSDGASFAASTLDAFVDGVRIIWGVEELEIAARTFVEDYRTETIKPWLICLPHVEERIEKVEPSSVKSLCREWKTVSRSPADLLTLEMRTAITSVVVFNDSSIESQTKLKLNYHKQSEAMFELCGGKFENLDIFRYTMRRVLDHPNTVGTEVIPGKDDEPCIVRKVVKF